MRVPIDSISPHPKNYRGHPPEQIEQIRASVRQFGQYREVVVSSDSVILCGHGVWEACKAEGHETVETHPMDFPHDDPRAAKLLVADNELSRLAVDDQRKQAELLASILQNDTLMGTAWTPEGLDTLIGTLAAEDFVQTTGFPELADGDRAPFQQMTFTLSDEQAETVKAAMQAARDAGPFVDTGNENGNGNALARVCEAYRG